MTCTTTTTTATSRKPPTSHNPNTANRRPTMGMRDIDAQQEWCKEQSKTGGAKWYNLCQKFSRSSLASNHGPYGGTAAIAWDNIKKKYRVDCPDPRDNDWWASIPRGALIYSQYKMSSGGAGHAWVAAGDMSAWSNDARRHGWIDRVDIRPRKWGWNGIHDATVGYAIGTQYYTRNDGFFVGLGGRWDNKIPPYENALKSFQEGVANKAAYRVSCRLIDLDMGDWQPVAYTQKWPTKAWTKWAEANGTDPNHYSETDHAALFA